MTGAYLEGAEPAYTPPKLSKHKPTHTAQIMRPGCQWQWNSKPITVLTYLVTAAVCLLKSGEVKFVVCNKSYTWHVQNQLKMGHSFVSYDAELNELDSGTGLR